MSDQEFEKRVRQELNDLRITPSGSTWVKIEEELKQKRRRRPLLWLPVAFLGLIAGGYFVMNQPATKQTTPVIAKTEPTASKTLGNQNSQTQRAPIASSSTNTTKINQDQPTKTLHSTKTAAPLSSGTTASAQQSKSGLTNSISPSGSNRVGLRQATKPSGNDNLAKANKKDGHKNDLIAAVVDDMLSDNEHQQDAIVEIQNQPSLSAPAGEPLTATQGQLRTRFTVDGAFNYLVPNVYSGVKKLNNTQPIFTQAAPKPILIQKKSKWSYAITASAGSTMIGEGNLGVNKSMVEDVSLNVASLNSGGIMRPNNPSPGPYRPSSLNPGLGYTFGGIVKRELSNRFAVSAGLNYARLTTYSTVGQQVNQTRQLNNGPYGVITVSSYFLFQEDEPKEYTNRYHFIELPVTLHTTLIRSKTLPVYWNAGISLSRLLTSNSLFFDGTSGVYYRDQKLINRTQTALLTGFNLSLFNRSKHPLWIGPELRYNLSRILKKDINGNKHLMYLGVDMKWFLKK